MKNIKVVMKLTNILEEKDNSIGNKISDKARQIANVSLVNCKCQEQQKISEGYVWVTNGKTSKLIHPDKLENALEDGFVKSKH